MLPLDANIVQNPTVTFATVEHEEIPKGHCCSASLLLPNDFSGKARQLSDVKVCDKNDEKILKFIDREVMAIEKGLLQGAQETRIRSESLKASTAMLLELVKLQFKNELTADTCDHLGNVITLADG
jgi:hypothetical protein